MRTGFRFFCGSVLVLALLGQFVAAQENLPPEVVAYADIVFYNGKVLTADDSFRITDAVAIRDGRFLAVGDSARILKMAGPNTRRVDLQGKTVVPGFIDTHFHLHNYSFNPTVNNGFDLFPTVGREELEGDETKDSLLRVLRKRGQQDAPRDGWLVFTDRRDEGHSILERQLFPLLTQQDMDEAFPLAIPAAVGPSHGNNYSGYVLNKAGLQIALDRLPTDTRGIERDPKTGAPTGKLTGPAAELFGRGVLPWPDMDLALRMLRENMPKYTAQGLTLIQTKTPGYVMAALRELWVQGDMPIRWRASIDVGPDAEVAFKYLGNLTDLGDPFLRITSGSGGVPQAFFDATYQSPKALPGRERADRREPSPEEMWATFQALKSDGCHTDTCLAAKYGWSMTNVHNNGDLSTDVYLSEIEKGLKERVIEAHGQRFATDHSLMLTLETREGNQFEKMKKLGIIPSLNAGYLVEPMPVGSDRRAENLPTQIELLTMQWGSERVARMLPAKSLINAGFKPTSESDRWYFPASYPLWLLEKLVTRKDDKIGNVWGPDERVSRQEALWMKTNWGARYTGDQKDVGTIEPGKLADLVVLDKDYMTVPEDDISKIRVLMTVIGGKVVYDQARDGWLFRPGEDLPSVVDIVNR